MLEIVSFFIYNSSLCKREGEEEKKLIYYYPQNEQLFRKINNVGLCEAVVQFGKTFSPGYCNSMHTLYHSYAIYQPEDQYWMVMTVSTQQNDENLKLGERVADFLCQEILKLWSSLFKLLHSSFLYNMEHQGLEKLKAKTNLFFTDHLMRMTEKLKSSILFSGMQYVKCNRGAVLNLKSILGKCSDVSCSILFYKEQVILSDLDIADCCLFVKYFINKIKPNLGGLVRFVQNNKVHVKLTYGSFSKLSSDPMYMRTLSNGLTEMDLLIYKVSHFCLCFFVPNTSSHMEICRKVDSLLGAYLSALATSTAQLFSKTPLVNINHNLQSAFLKYQDSTVASANIGTFSESNFVDLLPFKIVHAICDIRALRTFDSKTESETVEKVQNDFWVSAKKMDNKEVYAILHHKNANLIHVNDDIRKMSNNFDTMFFSE